MNLLGLENWVGGVVKDMNCLLLLTAPSSFGGHKLVSKRKGVMTKRAQRVVEALWSKVVIDIEHSPATKPKILGFRILQILSGRRMLDARDYRFPS